MTDVLTKKEYLLCQGDSIFNMCVLELRHIWRKSLVQYLWHPILLRTLIRDKYLAMQIDDSEHLIFLWIRCFVSLLCVCVSVLEEKWLKNRALNLNLENADCKRDIKRNVLMEKNLIEFSLNMCSLMCLITTLQ